MLEMQRNLKILENVLGKPASREWFAIAWTTLTRFNHSSFFRLILIIIVTMIIILIMIYQCNGDDGGIFYWPRFNGGPQFCQFSHRIFLEVSFAARSKVEPEESVHRLNNTSGIRICTVVNLFLTLFFGWKVFDIFSAWLDLVEGETSSTSAAQWTRHPPQKSRSGGVIFATPFSLKKFPLTFGESPLTESFRDWGFWTFPLPKQQWELMWRARGRSNVFDCCDTAPQSTPLPHHFSLTILLSSFSL